MTENEAVEALRLINTSRVHPFYSWEEMAEVRDIAISALKEIQQYRKIGTVEECKELASIIKKAESNELAKVIDEWIKYKKIGTVEECREAVEKQKPKAPAVDKYHHDCCPNCGWVVAGDTGYGKEYLPHCENCGQKILWDERLEETEDE